MRELLNFEEYDEFRLEETTINPEVLESLPSYKMHSEGSLCCYDDSYSMVNVVLQDMGAGTYWAFLRDYGVGYIRELGSGLFVYDESQFEDGTEFAVIAGVDLGRRVESGEIDLDKEIYDYFHVLPSKADVRWLHSGPVISVAEAANRLGCSGSRVKKMAESRMLEAYRKDGEVMITEESVDSRLAYIDQHGKPTKSTTFEMMNRCAVMTPDKTDACYNAAIDVSSGGADVDEMARQISQDTGMNENSARMYIKAVLAMLGGEPFTKDINTYSVNRYLDRIYEDFGAEAMPTARHAIAARNEELKKKGYPYAYYREAVSRSRQIHV